jgi:hypothetical protein
MTISSKNRTFSFTKGRFPAPGAKSMALIVKRELVGGRSHPRGLETRDLVDQDIVDWELLPR